MNKLIGSLLVATALFTSAGASAQEGRYGVLNPAQPTSTKKIEVLEFFFYECSHCYDLHPKLAAWEKSKPQDVEISYVPTIFRDTTEPLARAFYALESLGQIKQLDDAIYRAIHIQQQALYDLDSISALVGKHGVDRNKFTAAYNSFTVQSRVTRAKQMIRSYGVNGTPTIVVAGKYVITGLHPEETISTLNEVVAMVRKQRSKR